MASFTKKTNSNGTPVYRNVSENKPVKAENIPEKVLEKLDIVPEGTEVPENDEIDTTKVPVADEPAQSEDTERIHLDNTLCVNGRAYRGGAELDENGEAQDIYITVPKDMVKDLKRMDKEYKQYEKDLHRGQDFSLKAASVKVEGIQAQ